MRKFIERLNFISSAHFVLSFCCFGLIFCLAYRHWNFDYEVREGVFNGIVSNASVVDNGQIAVCTGVMINGELLPVKNVRDGKSDDVLMPKTKAYFYRYVNSDGYWFCSSKKLSFEEIQAFDTDWNFWYILMLVVFGGIFFWSATSLLDS